MTTNTAKAITPIRLGAERMVRARTIQSRSSQPSGTTPSAAANPAERLTTSPSASAPAMITAYSNQNRRSQPLLLSHNWTAA